jgi:hypothetical protein
MKRWCAVVLLFCCSVSAYAKDKAEPQYQDGVLISFRTISTGSSCSSYGNTNGSVDDNGKIVSATHSTGSCSNNVVRLYTIKVADQTYVVRHAATGGQKATALATMGWGALFMKQSVLANQLPGTHVLVRSDPHGFYVKMGKKESKFEVVEAK